MIVYISNKKGYLIERYIEVKKGLFDYFNVVILFI